MLTCLLFAALCIRAVRRARLLCLPLALFLSALVTPGVAHAQTGTIAGTVTNAATAVPLAGGSLRFCTSAQVCVTTAVTNASGAYSVTLAAGTYFANTNTLVIVTGCVVKICTAGVAGSRLCQLPV